MSDTLSLTESPSLAPAAPSLSSDQRRFLAAHMQCPMRWQWCFKETLLRVTTIAGEVASIWKFDLEDMVRAGLLAPGVGFSYRVTDAGRCV